MGKSIRKELKYRLRHRLNDEVKISRQASQKICRHVRDRLIALFFRAGRISRLRASDDKVRRDDLHHAWDYERVLCSTVEEEGGDASVVQSVVERTDTEPADRQLRDQYRKENIVKTTERRHRHALFGGHSERLALYTEEARQTKARLIGEKK